jgi:cell division protein FtsQ
MSTALVKPLDVKLMNLVALLLLLGALALTGVGLARWLAGHPVLAIQGITVQGDTNHNTDMTLRTQVLPMLRGTFLTVDMAGAKRAFEMTPWVRRVVVQREFPNRLRVKLQEHQAVAYWGAEGESTLVNSYGEVFEANSGEVDQDDLPRFNGPKEESAQILAMYQRLQPQFAAYDMQIESLELTGRGSWRAEMDSGAEFELGRGTEDLVVTRTLRFLSSMQLVITNYGRGVSALAHVDLRHEQGYALRLKGVSLLAGEKTPQSKSF